MVFDVAHVVEGQRFEVATAHVRVIATGTVFSVSTDAQSTHVHVFEGTVVVEYDGARDALLAGQSWDAGSPATGPREIIATGQAFAQERVTAPPRVVPASTGPVVAAPATPVVSPPAAVASSPAVVASSPSAVTSPLPPVSVPPRHADAREPELDVDHEAPKAEDPPASLDAARADLAAGRYDAALAKAAQPTRIGTMGEWDLVRGDALRALGRRADAAAAYESAARMLVGTPSREAAYTAAYIRYHDLHDGERALATLGDADDKTSPLEERALVLHAQILKSLDRANEAAVIAARYLDRYPRGASAAAMRTLATH
jgi:hypothetical protein